jgi:5-methylcytosine-specific restriction endonuclease McrA
MTDSRSTLASLRKRNRLRERELDLELARLDLELARLGITRDGDVVKWTEHFCFGCLTPLTRPGRKRWPRFCSRECMAAIRLLRTGSSPAPLRPTCATCGISLVSSGRRGPQKTYCSRSCQPGHRYATSAAAQSRAKHWIARSVRLAIFERDLWTCYLCNLPIDPAKRSPHPGTPSIDHVVPLGIGGLDTVENLAAAHLACNLAKGDNPAPSWAQPMWVAFPDGKRMHLFGIPARG